MISQFICIMKINLITFGGGYSITPVIINEFSDKRKLIAKDEIIDLIAIAQSVPGPLAVGLCILLGYKLHGFKGALTFALAAILPPLIVISLIYTIYDKFRDNAMIRIIMNGMSAAICAILFVSSYDLAKIALKKYPIFSFILLSLAFIAVYFLKLNVGYIIITAAFISYLFSSGRNSHVN